MKTKKQSLKSLGRRFDYVVPPARAPWDDWKIGKIYDIEYNGVKFQAARSGFVDDGLKFGIHLSNSVTWGVSGHEFSVSTSISNGRRDANSCGFARIYPWGKNLIQLAMYEWYLNNAPIKRGTVCYLIPHDEGELKTADKLRAILNKRGFRTVAVSRSRMGPYNVWLLVHPSDQILRKTTTIQVDFDDDLLAIATANSDGTESAGNSVGSDKQAGAVPNASANPAGVPGSSFRQRHSVSIG